MADVRQIAAVSTYIDAEVAEADRREIAAVSAYVGASVITADRREIAAVSAYICEVEPVPSALTCYGVAFQDEDGNTTTVSMTAAPGDRAAWDVDDHPDLHAKDIDDALSVYHLPTANRTPNDIIYWDGSKWATTNEPTFERWHQKEPWHAYGGFQDESEAITINTVDVWEHITNATNDLWTGLEADGLTLSDDVMTITNHGDYTGSLSLTYSALNGKDFQIRVYNITKAEVMGYHIGQTTTGAANFVSVALPLYLECNAGDQLRMEIRCTTDSTNPTVRSAVFYLTYLHE